MNEITLVEVSSWAGVLRWFILFFLIFITFLTIHNYRKDDGKRRRNNGLALLIITIIAMPFLILQITAKTTEDNQAIAEGEINRETLTPKQEGDVAPSFEPLNPIEDDKANDENRETPNQSNIYVHPAKKASIPKEVPKDEEAPSADPEPTPQPDPQPMATVSYKIIHKKMNIKGDGYDIAETIPATGAAGEKVTPEVKTYEGFDSPSAQEYELTDDDNQEIIYQYTRQKRVLTLVGEYIETTTPAGEYYYDTPITLRAKDRDGYSFVSWNNGATTQEITFNLTSSVSLEPSYTANQYSIIFDGNGNTSGNMSNQSVTYDTDVTLNKNQFKRENYEFVHWNTRSDDLGDSYDDEDVIHYQTVGNTTLYAIWEETNKLEFVHPGACTFHGSSATITGDECQDFAGKYYIDTGVKLYSTRNADKDFVVSFDINEYTWGNQDNKQPTFFGDKIPSGSELYDGAAPGAIIRGYNSTETGIEFSSKYNGNVNRVSNYREITGIHSVKLIRKDGALYFNINNSNIYVLLQDQSTFNQFFDLPAWFGAYPTSDLEGQQRYLTGTISNMVVRLGDVDLDTYRIEFVKNGGNMNDSEYYVEKGTAVSTLPTPTRNTYLFDGWHIANNRNSEQVQNGVIPTEDARYYALWTGDITHAKISKRSFDMLVGDEDTLTISSEITMETWTLDTEDYSIATIDQNGKITAIGTGTTNIIITGNRSGEYLSVAVTVGEPEIKVVCKVATELHSETCKSTGSCTKLGIQADTDVEYGTIPTNSTPEPGYAYDCDVNNDGIYDKNTERFYYYASNDNKAALIYSSNYEGESGAKNEKNYPYTSIEEMLPNTTTQWTNPNISIRIPKYSEITDICDSDFKNCTWIFETTRFISNTTGRSGIWLSPSYNRIHSGSSSKAPYIENKNGNNGVRPVIEVPMDSLEEPSSDRKTITFDAQGGNTLEPRLVNKGKNIGTLPTPTRENYVFDGWYTNNEFSEKVESDYAVSTDITIYAKWQREGDTFPVAFAQSGACIFNGSENNITGDECSRYHDQKYIDTGIELYNEENYKKDFEIGLTIESYTQSGQESQATFMNSKDEKGKYPGSVIRIGSGFIEIKQTIDGEHQLVKYENYQDIHEIKIVRKNGIVYYSVNNGDLIMLSDLTGEPPYTDVPVWFGASLNGNGTPFRHIKATMSNMYIKLGTYADNTTYDVSFDANGGTVNPSVKLVTIGKAVGNLPQPEARAGYTFLGWFTDKTGGTQITKNTIPAGHVTYYAHWHNGADNIVDYNAYNDAVNYYFDRIASWKSDPKATMVANLQTNFEAKGCNIASDNDSGAFISAHNYKSSNVNCGQPNAYDTGTNAALKVYLSDENRTKGNEVLYTDSGNGKISNLIPGQVYRWELASDSNTYGYVRTNANKRLLTVSGVRNIRDLGGMPVDTDGDGVIDGTTKYGVLFRGGRLGTSETVKDDMANLGVDFELSLSSDSELNGDKRLDNREVSEPGYYKINPEISDQLADYRKARATIKKAMEYVVADKTMYFHCRIGSDRTGTVAYILEGLLGVDEEARLEDYDMSHFAGYVDRTRHYDAKENNDKRFEYMRGYIGSNQEIYDWYMAESDNVEADKELIRQFKNKLVQAN